jgi:hypothetical protein
MHQPPKNNRPDEKPCERKITALQPRKKIQTNFSIALSRPWMPGDGLAEEEIKKAEARLGCKLPSSLKISIFILPLWRRWN